MHALFESFSVLLVHKVGVPRVSSDLVKSKVQKNLAPCQGIGQVLGRRTLWAEVGQCVLGL